MGDRLQTTIEALETLMQWRRLREVRMLADPPGLDGQLEALGGSLALRGGDTTDAYLAAFAISGNLRLVTFDRGFRRYEGLNLLLLEAPIGRTA